MAQLSRADLIDLSARPTRPRAAGRPWREPIAFALGIFVVLTFSQGWLMALAGPNGDADASGVIRAAYLPAYAVALWLALSAPARTFAAAALNPLLMLLIGLVFASWAWSIDPGVTLRRGFALGFTTLAGLALGARFGWRRLTEVLATGFLLIALASLVLGVAVPNYGRMQEIFVGAWRGVFQEKNALGSAMALGACVMLAAAMLNRERRMLWGAAAGLCLLLLLLSTSKTAMLCCGFGVAAFTLVFAVRRGPAVAVVAVGLGVAGLLALGVLVWLNADALLALIGKDATLTGRTRIWAAVLRVVDQRPELGFGYGATWSDPSGWAPLHEIKRWAHFQPRHSHNAWLEARLGLGWLGFGVWAAVAIWAALQGLWSAFTSRGGYLALPVLLVFFLTGLTETNAFVYNDLSWVIFCALAARMALGEPRAAAGQPR